MKRILLKTFRAPTTIPRLATAFNTCHPPMKFGETGSGCGPAGLGGVCGSVEGVCGRRLAAFAVLSLFAGGSWLVLLKAFAVVG
jgi:hypothetical protein